MGIPRRHFDFIADHMMYVNVALYLSRVECERILELVA